MCRTCEIRVPAEAPQIREKPPVPRWFLKWPGPGSNRRPSAFQADAITTDLRFQLLLCVLCAALSKANALKLSHERT